MQRYQLFIREPEDDVTRRIGMARVEKPVVGGIVRVRTRQLRYSDMEIIKVDEAEHKVILLAHEGTASCMQALERFAFKVLEAQRSGLAVMAEITDASDILTRVCTSGGCPAECMKIDILTGRIDLKLKEKRRG